MFVFNVCVCVMCKCIFKYTMYIYIFKKYKKYISIYTNILYLNIN